MAKKVKAPTLTQVFQAQNAASLATPGSEEQVVLVRQAEKMEQEFLDFIRTTLPL